MKIAAFFAILLTALALVPGGAHLFALANKIGMPQDQYFVAQSIYQGWALLGAVLFGALIANLILAVSLRRQRVPCLLAAAGVVLVGLNLAVFFVWTYPANVATANWTVTPADWESLRRQWEYSHAANAIVMLLALCCVTIASLRARH